MSFLIREVCGLPQDAGPVVGMCQFQDRIVVVTAYGRFYELQHDPQLNDYGTRQALLREITRVEKERAELQPQIDELRRRVDAIPPKDWPQNWQA